jgi:hypothetical protein
MPGTLSSPRAAPSSTGVALRRRACASNTYSIASRLSRMMNSAPRLSRESAIQSATERVSADAAWRPKSAQRAGSAAAASGAGASALRRVPCQAGARSTVATARPTSTPWRALRHIAALAAREGVSAVNATRSKANRRQARARPAVRMRKRLRGA